MVMNTIDILLLVPLAYAAWKGFKKGLIVELFTLLALLVGIYAGIHFSDFTAEKINGSIEMEDKYLPVVAFTLTFLVVGALIYFAGRMLEKMVELVNLSPVNKLLGVLLSLIKMVYTLSILIILVETYDERGNFIPTEQKKESKMYEPMKQVALVTIPAVEDSRIWLKNNVEEKKSVLEEFNETVNDALDLKEKADSLGVSIDELKEKLKKNEE